MPHSLEDFKNFNYIDYFVETGCYVGGGINLALNAGYKNIWSIEASKQYYDYCVSRFKNNKEVKLFYGESQIILENIISQINSRIVFWLDAHSQWDEQKINNIQPLSCEVDIISRHHIKNHVIMIDDWRLFHSDIIIKKLEDINSNYNIKFIDSELSKNDILVCSL